jgi:valyl-tRNA synthetase
MDIKNRAGAEEKIRKFWEKEKIYRFDSKKRGKIYSIDTPPPTVSGNMHAGHAFSYSQQDFIARFRRMFLGKSGQVFYPFGTDDNGLPTERLVERLNGVKSKDMSRKEFIELCLKTLKKITPGFVKDWKDLGVSADFDVFYSTIDENSRKISQKSFIDLYKAGRIYKKDFPTIWCPECQTAIAQAELEDVEMPSQFSTIEFRVNGKVFPIATTRPELIPACVAVFINPKDKRYKGLVGKNAKVPLFGFEVPIIGDESADMEKGTGALMVCSYGDKYDVEAVIKHKLEPKIIFNYDGTLKVDGYEGLKIKEAREKILDELEKRGLVIESKSISHMVNVHDKCGTEIEFLPTEQWFIGILDKKKELLSKGKKIKWYPKHMYKRYENWVRGLEWDWTISRNRHFGIPIPVWQCKNCGEIILPGEEELPVDPIETKKKCPKCKLQAIGETKVLDTWATSPLTPKIASSLVGGKVKIPYSLRPQAHDIIRTWAFYTIVKSYYHEKKIPWNEIMVSGFATLKGEKMAKSKGIVVDPRRILSEHGADALRFWASGSNLGEDLDYREEDLIAGKRFVNKLINASKFVFMNLTDYHGDKPKKMEKIDGLFLSKMDSVIKKATKSFVVYEYSKARQEIEQFFWKDFADNYLEIVKKRVYQGEDEERLSAQYTLYQSLLAVVKMIAPIMPFVTEEIYQEYFKKFEKEKSIHLLKWPKPKSKTPKYDDFVFFTEMLSLVRKEKTNKQKPMNSLCLVSLPEKDFRVLKSKGMIEDFKNVTNSKEIKEGKFKVEFIE